ncbi:MAG: cobalamin biosynthesis protein [Desulfobacter sp.]|nr:cobalamin biosynthesis protein [Desulfobacter sp.]
MDTARENKINTKMAVWAITPNGILLGLRLCACFENTTFFIPEKKALPANKLEPFKIRRFNQLKDELCNQFRKFTVHVFIFSTGISVRLIAPLLLSKTTDPAVVVVDEKGYSAISLISGHLGGANQWAAEIGKAINAVPVITTATDINHLPSIDLLSQKADLYIENPGAIKKVNMKFLKGQPLVIDDPKGLITPLIPDVFIGPWPEKKRAPDLLCSWKTKKVSRETLILRPRVLIVGIGCNRGTPHDKMIKFLCQTFERQGLSLNSISILATTEVKADESGILELSKTLNCPIHFYGRTELNSVETIENPSKMAEKYLGVKSVCEAAAILGAQRGQLIVPKQKTREITLAIAVPE